MKAESAASAPGPATPGGRAVTVAAAVIVFGILTGVVTLLRARNAFFLSDDFIGIQDPNPWLLALKPYEGHLSFFSGTLWVAWLEAFGAGSYTPFLLLAIAITIASATAVALTAYRMLGALVGLACGAWVLLLGPAFQNHLWDQASTLQLAVVILCVVLALVPRALESTAWLTGVCILAVIGCGLGGLGFGVLAGTAVLLFVAGKRGAGLALAGLAVIAVLVGGATGGAAAGQEASLYSRLARVPGFLLVSVQATVGSGLGLPVAMAGAVALVVIALLAWAAVDAVRRPDSLAARAVVLMSAYLLVTWGSIGFARGIKAEAASPRYLGVTGPVLLLAVLAALTLALRRWPGASPRARATTAAVAVAVVLLGSALNNTQVWLDARTNANYLGAANLARLSAMHAGREWIDAGYKPPGEGLGYVRQGRIERAWERHGSPDLDPVAATSRFPGGADAMAFVETALDAGAIRPATGRPAPRVTGSCRRRLAAKPGRGRTFRFSARGRVKDATVAALGSFQVVFKAQPGRTLELLPLQDTGVWDLSVGGGCLVGGGVGL